MTIERQVIDVIYNIVNSVHKLSWQEKRDALLAAAYQEEKEALREFVSWFDDIVAISNIYTDEE